MNERCFEGEILVMPLLRVAGNTAQLVTNIQVLCFYLCLFFILKLNFRIPALASLPPFVSYSG